MPILVLITFPHYRKGAANNRCPTDIEQQRLYIIYINRREYQGKRWLCFHSLLEKIYQQRMKEGLKLKAFSTHIYFDV